MILNSQLQKKKFCKKKRKAKNVRIAHLYLTTLLYFSQLQVYIQTFLQFWREFKRFASKKVRIVRNKRTVNRVQIANLYLTILTLFLAITTLYSDICFAILT